MCGIAVYCGSSEQRKQQLAQEFRRISYRGPDNTVVKDFGPNGWMGFHRLKIMDCQMRVIGLCLTIIFM